MDDCFSNAHYYTLIPYFMIALFSLLVRVKIPSLFLRRLCIFLQILKLYGMFSEELVNSFVALSDEAVDVPPSYIASGS